MDSLDLPLIWALIIAFAVFMYVALDGFDLGIGILFPFVEQRRSRDQMMHSIAPVWDGNETWLVLGGGGLFAVFPVAYSILLTAFYAPLIIMLLALVLRGVAFEFRERDERHRPIWDFSFAAGSWLATFCQGVVLGTFVQGVDVSGRQYAGGWFDWCTPFSLLVGASLVAGYALLGAGWLVMKTEGALRENMYQRIRPLTVCLVGGITTVSVATPWLNEAIAQRWFSWPNALYFAPVPILTATAAYALLRYHRTRAQRARTDSGPFLLTLILFALSYLGLGVSLFPMVVPHSIDIWAAAAPDQSLSFLLIGAVVLLPLILVYTSYTYWVFRGKVPSEASYH
ncbi:MAG: cytochrome d ubiquinol oxidase subunit II [Gammaproteobacteria bacterium]|nr:cytochrome d ubiquinol oxidase subunit II [Gammaproteobacteria bacterium]